MTIYNPSATKLTPFERPDDGDDVTAASVGVGLEAIADGVEYLNERIVNRQDEFLASGTWTCPAEVYSVELEGCGSGGGGGTGGTGTATTDRWSPGGSGGGAAPLVSRKVPVTPGVVYTVTIPAGGASDTDGGDTTFDALATFRGGGKGGSATGVQSITSTKPMVMYPGTIKGAHMPAGGGFWPQGETIENANGILVLGAPGTGGAGVSSNSGNAPSRNGMPSETGYAGGSSGAHGASSGSYRGGGGGGGGGGGPYGVGANGAAGPAGNGAGAGTAGSAGSSAAANTGAGGGGGSAGSSGTSGTPAGGAGGVGGSGRLIVRYVGKQAVVA